MAETDSNFDDFDEKKDQPTGEDAAPEQPADANAAEGGSEDEFDFSEFLKDEPEPVNPLEAAASADPSGEDTAPLPSGEEQPVEGQPSDEQADTGEPSAEQPDAQTPEAPIEPPARGEDVPSTPDFSGMAMNSAKEAFAEATDEDAGIQLSSGFSHEPEQQQDQPEAPAPVDLSQWTGSIETSGKVTDGEPQPAQQPEPEPAVDEAPEPQEPPAPVPSLDDAELDEDEQASMPSSGAAAAALHESEHEETPPGLYDQISSSKFNEELSSPQYDDAIAPSTAVAAVRRTARNAELKGKADDLFRGMWASIFYSGRMTGKATLVTAPSRNEGASTIACGLAVAGSGPAGGARVCLVDFNLRAPAIHELLGLRQAPGLTEVLTGAQELHNVIQGVNESLDVVTVGTIGGCSLDVLRSDAVEEFFEILNDAYDYILVDVAAANHYPDAQVLAGVIGDVVLVTHADQTPREAVAQAKKRLEAGGGKLVGLVLNQRSFPIPSFLYRRV